MKKKRKNKNSYRGQTYFLSLLL